MIIVCIKWPYGSGHTDEKRWWMTTMNANMLWRVAIHDEFLYVNPQNANESLPIWENCQSHAYSSSIQIFTNGVGIQLTRKWRKQTVRAEFAMQLHSCYCRNLVFLCIKGSLTSYTLCQVWCMNVDVNLSNQTTFHSSWYSGKWHAIFRICLSLDSYFIIFMSRRRMLIRYWEQTRNPKSFVVLFQLPRVDHVEQNDVIIACIKWPHESNHKPTVKKNEHMYVLQSWNWYTDHDLAYPGSAAHHSPSGLHLVGDWTLIHLQLNNITNGWFQSHCGCISCPVTQQFTEWSANFGQDLKKKNKSMGINLGKTLSIDPARYSSLLKPRFDYPNVS